MKVPRYVPSITAVGKIKRSNQKRKDLLSNVISSFKSSKSERPVSSAVYRANLLRRFYSTSYMDGIFKKLATPLLNGEKHDLTSYFLKIPDVIRPYQRHIYFYGLCHRLNSETSFLRGTKDQFELKNPKALFEAFDSLVKNHQELLLKDMVDVYRSSLDKEDRAKYAGRLVKIIKNGNYSKDELRKAGVILDLKSDKLKYNNEHDKNKIIIGKTVFMKNSSAEIVDAESEARIYDSGVTTVNAEVAVLHNSKATNVNAGIADISNSSEATNANAETVFIEDAGSEVKNVNIRHGDSFGLTINGFSKKNVKVCFEKSDGSKTLPLNTQDIFKQDEIVQEYSEHFNYPSSYSSSDSSSELEIRQQFRDGGLTVNYGKLPDELTMTQDFDAYLCAPTFKIRLAPNF